MPIEFSCPACRHWVGTPDAAAGKLGRCPNCKAVVVVPRESETPAASSAAPAAVIDFQCPHCRNLVRTPASAAGKNGRCPSCRAIVNIPLRSTIAPPAAPAAPTAKLAPDPRDPWLDLPPAARLGQQPLAAPPFAAPPPAPLPHEEAPAWMEVMERAVAEQRLRGGLAWERDSSLDNLVDTTFQLCSSAGESFDDMRLEGGYSNPLSFYIFSFLVYQLVTIGMYTGSFIFVQWRDGTLNQVEWLSVFHAVCLLVVLAIMSSLMIGLVSAFLSAGCMHLALLALGGARAGFESTLRVVCFSGGACAVLGATLILAPIAPIFSILLPIVGLHRVHRVPHWKSALAYLLGTLLTIAAVVLIVWIAIVLFVSALISQLRLQDILGRGA